MKKSLLLIIIPMLIILAGCSNQGTNENQIQDDLRENSNTSSSPQEESQVDRVIELDAFNFGYSQENITVEQGDRIRIEMTSSEGTHDFVIDQFEVQSAVISQGGETTIEFVAEETGEFPFYCSIGNHRERGMEGTLIVE